MNIDKKLDIFSNVVEKEVESRRISILLHMDHEVENAVHEKISATKEQHKIALAKIAEDIRESNILKIAEKISENKKLLVAKRQAYTEEIFEDAQIQIKAYCLTKDYKEKIYGEVSEYIKKENNIEIYFSGSDADITQQINKEYGSFLQENNIKIMISAADFIGGYKILYMGINVIINNTYLSRLEEERKNFSKFRIQL